MRPRRDYRVHLSLYRSCLGECLLLLSQHNGLWAPLLLNRTSMSHSDDESSVAAHESAAPRLPLGEGASAASAALPGEGRRVLQPVAGVVGVFVCGLVAFLTLYATQPLLPL